MSLTSHSHRLRSFTISFVSRFIVLFILSSFAVTLLPIVSTSAEQSSMPCCAGKSAEHCDSGLTAPKPRPVVTEVMCGRPPVPTSSSAPVVTDPVAIEPVVVEPECEMECGACATATSRHKRQKSLIQARTTQDRPASTNPAFDNSTTAHSSNENWTRINPRGPPAVR